MKAGDTLFLLDVNGIVDKRDVPVNVHARERFDAALEKGTLVVLDEAAVEEYTSASGGILFRRKPAVEQPAPKSKPKAETPSEPAPAGDSGAPDATAPAEVAKPAKSAGVGAWREFAVAQGMDAEAAAAADKKTLVAQFGG